MYLNRNEMGLWADTFINSEGVPICSNGVNHYTKDQLGILEPVNPEEMGVVVARVTGGMLVRFDKESSNYDISAATLGMVEDYRRRMVHPICIHKQSTLVWEDNKGYAQENGAGLNDRVSLNEAHGIIRYFKDQHRLVEEQLDDSEDVLAEIQFDAVVFLHKTMIPEELFNLISTYPLELNVSSTDGKSIDLALICMDELEQNVSEPDDVEPTHNKNHGSESAASEEPENTSDQ